MAYSWVTKPLFWYQKWRYGKVLSPTYAWAKSPPALYTFLLFYKAVTRRNSPISKTLRSYVSLRVAQIATCRFCIDFNMSRMTHQGITEADIAAYKQSAHFSEAEKSALDYAEMIVNGEMDPLVVNELKKYYSDRQQVELTALIGCQLLSSRFNRALEISNN